MLRHSISQRNRSRGINTWYGRIYDDSTGETRYQSLGTDKKKEAKEWMDRMNSARFMPERVEARDVPVLDAVRAYLRNTEISKGPKSLTLGLYTTQGNALTEWCAKHGVQTVLKFSPANANEYAATFSGQAPITRRTKILNMRTFFKWAIDTYELAKANPFKSVKPPKATTGERYFWTPEQIDRILDKAPNPHHRAFWALMAFAGLRRTEAMNAKPSDIRNGLLHLVGKGSKFATVPVSERLQAELNRLGEIPQDSPFAAVYVDGYDHLKKACKSAKIEADGEPNFHRFRHSFASNLLRSGASITEVQRLMRHENVTLTLSTYAHLLPNDLIKAVNLIK